MALPSELLKALVVREMAYLLGSENHSGDEGLVQFIVGGLWHARCVALILTSTIFCSIRYFYS